MKTPVNVSHYDFCFNISILNMRNYAAVTYTNTIGVSTKVVLGERPKLRSESSE